jgi:hypothetical protein
LIEKKPLVLSASQISLFKRCKRAWYLRYVEKIKEPPKPWLKKGNDFHRCIEKVEDDYFDSDVIEMVKIAFNKEILYVPNKFLIEHPIKFNVNDMASIRGYVDFLDVSNGKINDHKSISSKKWALTEETIKTDLQLNIYGFWYLQKIPNKKHVYYRHNQLHKIDPDLSSFIEVKRSRDDVMDYWCNEIKPIIDEIVDLYLNCEKKNYLCNLDACKDYGGCGYELTCINDKYM